MRDRVALFQQHCHPVWNSNAPFDSRITRLPLYALEFNNYDRDKQRNGPTIAHYSPARRELVAIASMCQSLGPDVTVLDIGCGNGFIGSLLAREAVRVIGIDDLSWKPPQIRELYDSNAYELRVPCSLSDFRDTFQVALCSWMVPDANLTTEILARGPALVIHIFSLDCSADGLAITGSNEAYRCQSPYVVLGRWGVVTPGDYFAALDCSFSANNRKLRVVEVWKRKDAPDVSFPELNVVDEEYDWELERFRLNRIRVARGLEPYEIPSRWQSLRSFDHPSVG